MLYVQDNLSIEYIYIVYYTNIYKIFDKIM